VVQQFNLKKQGLLTMQLRKRLIKKSILHEDTDFTSAFSETPPEKLLGISCEFWDSARFFGVNFN